MLLMIVVVVLLVACFGILLNVYVFYRLHKFARKEPMRFENGCGLPLLVMTIVGMLALVGVVVFGVFGSLIIAQLHEHSNLQNVICKLMTYWTHVTTNVSMWCWVLMSAIRYIAIYHPFVQLHVWLLPRRGIQLIVLLSLLLNASFIGAVEFRINKCQVAEMFGWKTATWWLHLAEIGWSFFVPVLFTLCMDGRVLLIDPPSALVRRHARTVSADDMNDEEARRTSITELSSLSMPPRLRSTMFKWLAITSLYLQLNAPDNLLRLAIMFADVKEPVWQWYPSVRFGSQMCYFGQFGFNAFYLSLVVCNWSSKPIRSTPYALSVLNQSLIITQPATTRGNPSAPSAGSLQQPQLISGCCCGLVGQSDNTHATNTVMCTCII